MVEHRMPTRWDGLSVPPGITGAGLRQDDQRLFCVVDSCWEVTHWGSLGILRGFFMGYAAIITHLYPKICSFLSEFKGPHSETSHFFGSPIFRQSHLATSPVLQWGLTKKNRHNQTFPPWQHIHGTMSRTRVHLTSWWQPMGFGPLCGKAVLQDPGTS